MSGEHEVEHVIASDGQPSIRVLSQDESIVRLRAERDALQTALDVNITAEHWKRVAAAARAERDEWRDRCLANQAWLTSAAAERDEAVALLRRARKHYTIGLPLDEDIKDFLARLDAAAKADQ